MICLSLIALLGAMGCGGASAPEEAEVKAKIVGKYCSEDSQYMLELSEDGRYTSKRNQKSIYAGNFLMEKCEGNYSVRYDEDASSWMLSLEKSDKNSNPLVRCSAAEVLIWEAEKGYVVVSNDTVVSIQEPFDKALVTNNCGGKK